jgi:hypothetical protein
LLKGEGLVSALFKSSLLIRSKEESDDVFSWLSSSWEAATFSKISFFVCLIILTFLSLKSSGNSSDLSSLLCYMTSTSVVLADNLSLSLVESSNDLWETCSLFSTDTGFLRSSSLKPFFMRERSANLRPVKPIRMFFASASFSLASPKPELTVPFSAPFRMSFGDCM